MAAYLFTHFTGEAPDGEQIYFSVSRDGLHWRELNGGRPVLRWEAGTGGVLPVTEEEYERLVSHYGPIDVMA